MCKVVQNMHKFPKNVNFAKCGKLCIICRVLNQLCKMCKIEQNIHNFVKCAKRCEPGDLADQAKTGKVPKGGRGILNPKSYIAKFGPLNRAFSALK